MSSNNGLQDQLSLTGLSQATLMYVYIIHVKVGGGVQVDADERDLGQTLHYSIVVLEWMYHISHCEMQLLIPRCSNVTKAV